MLESVILIIPACRQAGAIPPNKTAGRHLRPNGIEIRFSTVKNSTQIVRYEESVCFMLRVFFILFFVSFLS
jgi:hypothetical protein